MNNPQLYLPLDNLAAPPVPEAWRPIHYLGSKLRIVEPIRIAIDRADPSMGPVCDLFAGSGTVSAALAQHRDVIAVDIQEYSRVLCSAILSPTNISDSQTRSFLTASQLANRPLSFSADPLIEYEQECFRRARSGHVLPLCELIENPALAEYARAPLSRPFERARRESADRIKTTGLGLTKETLIFRHFGGLYFSYRQSTELDAILTITHHQKGSVRDCLLAAAISTASDIVNTVGKHFAQPIKPRDNRGEPKVHLIRKILKDRNLNTFDIFASWLEKYRRIPPNNRLHRAMSCDFEQALRNLDRRVSVVYADPPYTREHYSRFYHVLETMARRDDPQISTTRIRSQSARLSRGMYRLDRHQSPFCIRSEATGAFRRLFGTVRDLGTTLVLSYSPSVSNRVMTVDDLSSLASEFFADVEITSAGRISHSKLNTTRFNTSISDNAELIFLCR